MCVCVSPVVPLVKQMRAMSSGCGGFREKWVKQCHAKHIVVH